jgi:hypothetical protein
MYCVQFTSTETVNNLFRTKKAAEAHMRRVAHLSPRLGVRDLHPMLGESRNLQYFCQVFQPWEESHPSGWFVWSKDQ